MKTKTKITLYFLATFCVGVIIGGMVNGYIAHYMREKNRKIAEEKGLEHVFIERIIRPDASQREHVERIVGKYADRMEETRIKSMEAMKSLVDSVITELTPYLEKDQIERLQRPPRDPLGVMRSLGKRR